MKEGEEVIDIATYETTVEAHLAKGLLEESGIPAFLRNETQLYPGVPIFGDIKLCIMKKDEERAIEALNNNEV